MKRFLLLVLLSIGLNPAYAELTIEITGGSETSLPIAVVPFSISGAKAATDVASVIRNDLKRSGRFSTLPVASMLARPDSPAAVDFHDWRVLKTDYLVIGKIKHTGGRGYEVIFQLFDVYKGEQISAYSVPTTASKLRSTAHRLSDIIYQKLLGERGAFSTRIAYVTKKALGKGKSQSALYVADADGFNAQRIVTSKEPIMSPAWSPDGQKLAYVSFEKGKPAIYVQTVLTGKRQKIAAFKGINGAPAWSPNGRQLAMTLSKGGNPDIYIMDIASRRLRQLTKHWAIDTEPAWSPDGKQIVFTSDRGGKPQIYRISANGGQAKRITWEGRYNARASYSADGKLLTLITRVGAQYRIGVIDLANNSLDVLTDGALDESPSFAPNSRMIIYATKDKYRGYLAAVSVDGSVQQKLAETSENVQEPAWSPFSY